jgi:hypothetical protein
LNVYQIDNNDITVFSSKRVLSYKIWKSVSKDDLVVGEIEEGNDMLYYEEEEVEGDEA